MEITAIFKRERVRWSPDTAVLDCRLSSGGSIAVICDCEKDDLQADLAYRFSGEYKNHKTYGKQFKADCFALDVPVSKQAIIFYIQRFNGIGPKTAEALWLKHEHETLDVIANSPEVLEKLRISHENALFISEMVRKDLDESKTKIELAMFMAGFHFPKTLHEKIYKKYGVRSIGILTINPYILLPYERCGFKTVDAFALAKGYNPVRIKRQALFTLYTMRDSEDVWFNVNDIESKLIKQFGCEKKLYRTLKLLIKSNNIALRKESEKQFIAEACDARNERIITEEVKRHLTKNMEVQMDVSSLSGSQAEAITKATELKIGCLTGGPGTGKTFTIARYIRAIIARYGSGSVCVVAPTGKAVVRSREMLESIGVSCDSKTIHSLVLAQENGFEFNYDFIISDESSMIDAALMKRLLVHNPNSSFLFVGDDGQLFPVGKGCPFADFLNSGVIPVGKLTETRRNSGKIVSVCHAIRQDKSWEPSRIPDIENGENLVYVPSGNYIETIRSIFAKHRNGPDFVKQFQVITGVNKGENGVFELNETLRPILNPSCDASVKYSFNDPVICLKNGRYRDAGDDSKSESDEGQIYVSNGEIGYCFRVEKNIAFVDFGSERMVRFRFDNLNFSLAYAVTCHKMQGSETPIAVVLLDTSGSARMVCKREWLYTAISRAKKLCYLVGNIATAREYCRQLGNTRKTFLTELLKNG